MPFCPQEPPVREKRDLPDAPDDDGFINPVPLSFTRLNGGKVDNSVDKEENISWQD